MSASPPGAATPSAAGPVVIVGAGLSGVSFAGGLRAGGYAGEIAIVGDEAEAPYDRPPLSKAFQRDGDAARIRLDVSRLHDVRWLRGRTAAAIDSAASRLRLDDGDELPYRTLVLATGARPRTLPALQQQATVPVLTLRTIDDARRIRAGIDAGARLVIVGAGVIGLELAATARTRGADVAVVEMQPRVMNRCTPPVLAEALVRRHVAEGVRMHLGRCISGWTGGRLALDDGSLLEADLIVAGVGIVANDDLARAAGIACDDGIFVDGHAHTTCAGVLAIGDVTRQRHPQSGRTERIETWSNAQNQALSAARAWLDPSAPPYADVPWYWSDQFDLRVQVAGLGAGDDEVLRGDPAQGRFALIQLLRGRIVGAACVSVPRDFAALRKLIAAGASPARELLADAAIDLRKLGA